MLEEQDIVDGFFDAALEPELWAEKLGLLSDHIGGAAVNLVLIEKAGGSPLDTHFERVDGHAYARYINDYIAIDPRIPRILNSPVNTLLMEHDVLTEEEIRSGAVYNELLAVSGMRNQAIALLSAGAVYAGFGVAPGDDSRAFEPEQLQRLSRLLPQLRHAVRFYMANAELQMHRSALGDLWSQAAKGVVILDAQKKALFVNRAAEAMLDQGLLTQRRAQISFRERSSELAWQQALFRLSDGSPRRSAEFLAVNPATLEQFGVRLTTAEPVVTSFPVLKSPALVMLITPLSLTLVIGEQEVARFGQLFGITPAECAAVGAVAAGKSLDEHARDNGIAVDTARKQLKAAMGKCGVASQKALVARLERFCFLAGI